MGITSAKRLFYILNIQFCVPASLTVFVCSPRLPKRKKKIKVCHWMKVLHHHPAAAALCASLPPSAEFQHVCKAVQLSLKRKAISVWLNLHTWVRVHALAPDISVFHMIDTRLKHGGGGPVMDYASVQVMVVSSSAREAAENSIRKHGSY